MGMGGSFNWGLFRRWLGWPPLAKAGEGEAMVGVSGGSCQRVAGRPTVRWVERTEIKQGESCYACGSIALFGDARRRRRVAGWSASTRSGTGNDSELCACRNGIEDSRCTCTDWRGPLDGSCKRAVAKTGGDPLGTSTACPIWVPWTALDKESSPPNVSEHATASWRRQAPPPKVKSRPPRLQPPPSSSPRNTDAYPTRSRQRYH